MKRAFDIVASAIGLVVALPVMALLAIAVAASMGRPVLFKQVRVGLGPRDFALRKFRSMREAYDTEGRPLPDADRVTPLGRFLRRSRLDELPELWLILTGAMSFVGPRPLPRALLDARGVTEARSQVRPGLTGLAQVAGNTALADHEKFALDLLYIERASLWLDLAILFKTVKVVFAGERRDEALIREAMARVEARQGGFQPGGAAL
jgi:lipopolysaccharide/colanic/teichoic acid biosynthesis glycosyltransferase